MANVQITIRLGWEAGYDALVLAASQIGLNQAANKVRSADIGGWSGWIAAHSGIWLAIKN